MGMIRNKHNALMITELSKRLRVFSQDQIVELKQQIHETIIHHQEVADNV